MTTSDNTQEPPVFVLTASRSGSTLLRFILDSHPDLACPPETGMVDACAQLLRVRDALENAGSEAKLLTDPSVPSPHAIKAVRDAVDSAFGDYLRRRGKRRICDKTLRNVVHAEVLAQLYPDVKFICLYRHCMDVIASAVETGPWGVSGLGFDQFVRQYPGNSVAAVGSYWYSCAQSIFSVEKRHPHACHRVRYEDLVAAPEETMAAVFAFLGVEQVPGISQACFEMPHEANGPGDEKIWFTSSISTGSIGRGVIVPAAGLPADLLTGINNLLGELDYRLVDNSWNAVPGSVDPRADQDPLPATSGTEGLPVSAELETAISALRDRIATRSESELRGITSQWPVLKGQSILLIAQDATGRYDALTLRFGSMETASAVTVLGGVDVHDPVATVIAEAAVWHRVLRGAANLVTELGANRVRCVNRRDTHRLRSDEIHALAALLGIARVPLSDTPVHNGASHPGCSDGGPSTDGNGNTPGFKPASGTTSWMSLRRT